MVNPRAFAAPPPPVPFAAPAGTGGPVVLFDGVCGLCDRYVRFVLRHDHGGRFRFAPWQGAFAAQVAATHGLNITGAPSTIMVLESPGAPSERLRVRSDAVLAIFSALGGPWRLLALLRLIPRFLRDAIYRVVAGWRYRIFGRLAVCPVPPPAARDRFLA